ncbi:lactosylceramide 4-alpha-galactosyltransferase isoform X2 [Anabrus simplex]|uniref:lactosylceramide 4-alpha-galactosyltransferase isoform X2 n=1 Tax=Anabrus simplex TaxID=316456 RepID=UPI0034DCEF73
MPTKGKSIFFHETSCASSIKGKLVLTPRQACAVESAAKMNPDLDVYLLFASPIKNANVSQWSGVVRQLLTYPNVRIRHVSLDRYIAGSPLEDWYRRGALQTSRWPRSHASDVLRFLTLWKFGGTYLDLDIVVTRSLSGMSNFAGAESLEDVAAGVLNFAHDGVGHEMVTACLEDLRTQFRGDSWGHNGPGVITRVLRQVCGVRKVRHMTPERCRGFTVHPPSAFYPIPWQKWRLYFDEKDADRTMSKLNESLAIHVWNKFSVAENITVGSRQPYAQIAKKFCPKVYSHCGKIF